MVDEMSVAEFELVYTRCLQEFPVDRPEGGAFLLQLYAAWLPHAPEEFRADLVRMWMVDLIDMLCEKRIVCMHHSQPQGTKH
jgi:hypothetical protein